MLSSVAAVMSTTAPTMREGVGSSALPPDHISPDGPCMR